MQLPATIGKYRIEELLGSGTTDVYRAEDTVLNRSVAVKQLSTAAAAEEQVRARFLEEARLGAHLAHDNIVRTLDYGDDSGEHDSRPFVVTELLVGETVSSLLASGQLGDYHERARIALAVAHAIEYLHTRNIVHGDLKIENIHVEAETGRVRLLDFGPTGPETDVHAFGALFVEMLTGTRPAEAIDYGLLDVGVPGPLAEIVRDATHSVAGERPSFARIITQLEKYCSAIPPVEAIEAVPDTSVKIPKLIGTPDVPPHRRRLNFSQTAGMALVAAVIGGLMVGVLGVSIARGRMNELAGAAVHSLRPDEMVSISGGTFEFTQERRKVDIEPFEIDRTEVTNDQYAVFCEITNRHLPRTLRQQELELPVTGVTIEDARAYCFAQAKHLPTEMQWERAARGRYGARFPWGDHVDERRSNSSLGTGHLIAVDLMKDGATAEGVLNMIGNAAEWIDQTRAPSMLALETLSKVLQPPVTDQEPWYIVKGGSFRRSQAESAADLWLPAPGRYSADDLGFRCAK